MKTLVAMSAAALTMALLPTGCATAGGPKARLTEQSAPQETQRAADAVIYVSGLS